MEFLKIEIFFEVKTKYSSLFERKNYPLSNIFINNLLKNFKHFDKCYSKDQIPLIENNKSLIFNLEKSHQSGSHWSALSIKMMMFSCLIHLVLVIFQIIYIKFIKIIMLLQIYIEFKILIQIYVVCFVFCYVYTKLIQKINSYLF